VKKSNGVMQDIQYFFQSYLTLEKGVSPHTIHSYRDTLKLYLEYLKKLKRKSNLVHEDFTAQNVLTFLNDIEKTRGNAIRTRNHRLAVLKSFFSYLSGIHVDRASEFDRIVHLKSKRTPYRPVLYLTKQEITSLLESIDQSGRFGKRNYTMILLLYNTGARVQELCDLKVSNVRLESPPMITLTGKGNKVRHIPLWKETVDHLRNYLKGKSQDSSKNEYLFLNNNDEQLSRFGVNYILKAIFERLKDNKNIRPVKITPHVLRHTTAMHLLQSGVDISVIKTWLGHVDLNTTHGYVEIDLQMKEEALRKSISPKGKKPLDEILKKNEDVIAWLNSL
jgi:integrase/recombinase XerD